MFLSNITVFALFIIGLYWILSALIKGDQGYYNFIVLFAWLLTFGFVYFQFYSGHPHEQMMLLFWKNSFMPLNPFSGEFWEFIQIKVNKVLFEEVLYNKLGFNPVWYSNLLIIMPFLYLAGLVVIIRKGKPHTTYFILFPILLHLFISGIKKYPFDTRFVLYLSPLIYITIAYSIYQLGILLERLVRKRWPGIILIILILSIFPYKLSVHLPFVLDGTRESIYFLDKNYTPGQAVYINSYCKNIYKFYKKTGKVNWGDNVYMGSLSGPSGGTSWDPYADMTLLESIEGDDVWLLFGHIHYPFKPQYRLIMDSMKQTGKIKKSFKSEKSAVHLFKLTERD